MSLGIFTGNTIVCFPRVRFGTIDEQANEQVNGYFQFGLHPSPPQQQQPAVDVGDICRPSAAVTRRTRQRPRERSAFAQRPAAAYTHRHLSLSWHRIVVVVPSLINLQCHRS
jgi:hypothetical protein